MREFFDKWAHRHAGNSRPPPLRRRCDRHRATPDRRRAAEAERRHRMHRLRRVLCRVRCREVEPRLPRARGAQSGMDARERCARRRTGRAPPRGIRRCGLPFVPHDDELHRALPEEALAHSLHRRVEARDDRARPGQRVTTRAGARLWIAQRASAALLAFCVFVHLATIIYAVRGGLDRCADPRPAPTASFHAWGAFYSVFVLGAAIHAAIGLRTVAGEWLSFRGKCRGECDGRRSSRCRDHWRCSAFAPSRRWCCDSPRARPSRLVGFHRPSDLQASRSPSSCPRISWRWAPRSRARRSWRGSFAGASVRW